MANLKWMLEVKPNKLMNLATLKTALGNQQPIHFAGSVEVGPPLVECW